SRGGLVTVELLARVHGRAFWKSGRMDVIAAAAEIVVCVPGVGGSQNCDLGLGRCRSDDPGKGKSPAGWRLRPQIIQPRSIRRHNRRRRRKAALVPAYARLSEIAVGQGLAICLRTVLVHPADHPDELLLPPISPQRDLILFHGMNPVLG